MYNKIIVPTDGSKNSGREIKKALDLLEPNGEIIVVTVATRIRAHGLQRKNDLKAINQTLLNESKEIAEEFAKNFDSSVNVSIKVSSGDPADEIVKIADEENANLIVISSAGETGITKFLIGSVAEKVLKESKVDVLLVHKD